MSKGTLSIKFTCTNKYYFTKKAEPFSVPPFEFISDLTI